MAESRDILAESYDRIWELLEADDVWAAEVDEGNRIKFNEAEGTQQPEKHNTADGDYPEARLKLQSGTWDPWTDASFGTFSEEGCAQWMETFSVAFQLRLITQRLGLREGTKLLIQSLNALRKGGPRLGLDFVTRVQASFEQRDVDVNAEEETKRVEINLVIRLGLETQGKPLATV